MECKIEGSQIVIKIDIDEIPCNLEKSCQDAKITDLDAFSKMNKITACKIDELPKIINEEFLMNRVKNLSDEVDYLKNRLKYGPQISKVIQKREDNIDYMLPIIQTYVDNDGVVILVGA